MKIRKKCTFCNNTNLTIKHQFKQYSILRCENCQVLFRNLIFSRSKERALYNKNYYLNLQKEYFSGCLTPNPKDKQRFTDFEYRIDLLQKLEKDKKNIKVLDIGCGTGAFIFLAEKNGWQTWGIEISPFASKIAKNKFKVKVHNHDITDKNTKYGKYDIITLWESIANIENTPKLLDATRVHLVNKGKLAILTTVIDSWLYYIAEIIKILSFKTINYFVQEGYPIHHANHFTRSTLKKILRSKRFNIVYEKDVEIPYKYTKLPKMLYPALVVLGTLSRPFGKTIQILIVAEKY